MAFPAACLFEPISPLAPGRPAPAPIAAATAAPPLMPRRPQPCIRTPSPPPPPAVTPLSEISHLLRLHKYHKRRALQAQDHLHHLHLVAAKTARLSRAAHSVLRALAGGLHAEDKHSFVHLHRAFQLACDDAFRPPSAAVEHAPPPARSFLDALSPPSRDALVDFLRHVRYDGSFVADRLASLSRRELVGLLPARNLARSSDSIFGSKPARSISPSSRPLGFVVDAHLDLLACHAYASPLETLIFAPGALSQASPIDEPRLTDLWATVCARLLSDQTPGSEKVIPSLLDIWSTLLPWPGKHRVESWILTTLHHGAFLLEQPVQQQPFRARLHGRPELPPEDDARADAFYARAADSLLQVFADPSIPSAIPPGALRLCHSIFHRLAPSIGHQRAFPHFVVTRWLFSTFIMDLMAVPEAYGLLTDHYLSDIARQRILKEAAVRAQKAVFDVAYAWKHGHAVAAETVNRVTGIMSRFHPPTSGTTRAPVQSHGGAPDASSFMAVSLRDVSTALSALYPQRRPASVSSDFDNSKPGPQSSASSISGFSLFRHEKAFDPGTLTTAVSSHGVPTLGVADTDALVQELDESHAHEAKVREASRELEEFATGHMTSSRDFWEVFELPADSPTVVPMRESCFEAQSRRHRKEPISSAVANPVSPDLLSHAKTIEVLLYTYHPTHAEPPALTARAAWDELESLFGQAVQDSQARFDFVSAHHWFQQRHDIRAHISRQPGMGGLGDILDHVKAAPDKSIAQSVELERACEEWSASAMSPQVLRNSLIQPALDASESLRDKMFYVADVRTSAAYDETRSIASALRVMGKSRRHARPRMSPPLRHGNPVKGSPTNSHLKTEAQLLDILSAKPEHGGSNKLSDDQARATSQWMERQNVDNLCKGEERLHKLCMEVRKCVEQVTAHSDHSTIWGNALFARDGPIRQPTTIPRRPLVRSGHSLSVSGPMRGHDARSSASRTQTLSSASSRDFLDARSPTTVTNQSSSMSPFWSPATTEVDSPSSATSVISSPTQAAGPHALVSRPPTPPLATEQRALDRLRQRVASLLLSDLTSILFKEGSETDAAFWSGLGLELTERHFRTLHPPLHSRSIGSETPTAPNADLGPTSRSSGVRFGFEAAFAILLGQFSTNSNPNTKLNCIYDIDRLLVPYMAEHSRRASPTATPGVGQASGGDAPHAATHDAPSTNETSVAGFRDLFSRSTFRPSTIFRDLQYIAALVPSATLQETPRGKAFTHAAVAITGLKNEIRGVMVETADSIINYHSHHRGHGRASSPARPQRDSATFSAPPGRTPSAEDIARYTMSDAAYLYQIAAKEGDVVAQRELATLYLTHPELMDHMIAPFARPRDVFQEELEGKWKKDQDPNRCDPVTMCVAHHWMSLSAKGGDSLAQEYLRQREEMDSF